MYMLVYVIYSLTVHPACTLYQNVVSKRLYTFNKLMQWSVPLLCSSYAHAGGTVAPLKWLGGHKKRLTGSICPARPCCKYTPLIEPAIGQYVIFLSKRDLGIFIINIKGFITCIQACPNHANFLPIVLFYYSPTGTDYSKEICLLFSTRDILF